jgi:hypothetical protein
MINKEQKRERFMRDPLPVRLAGLAADLARVASSARHPTGAESVADMLEESQYFVEWTAAAAEPEIAAELVDLQRLVALWRKAWPDAQQFSTQRILLSVQAKKWSDQVLGYSGLEDLS